MISLTQKFKILLGVWSFQMVILSFSWYASGPFWTNWLTTLSVSVRKSLLRTLFSFVVGSFTILESRKTFCETLVGKNCFYWYQIFDLGYFSLELSSYWSGKNYKSSMEGSFDNFKSVSFLFLQFKEFELYWGAVFFLRSVQTFSWFLKSNCSRAFGHAETGSGAKKWVVLRREIFSL